MENYSGLVFLALPLLLLWMVISRTRRQQRVLGAAQAAVRPGLWVITTSGLHGKVVTAEAGDANVVIEIAPGVHTRWVRQAISEVFEDDPATRAAPAPVDAPADPQDRPLT